MKNAPPSAPRGKSGIALVVVLGFLAVLVIMGLGFAVSMRIERLVARSALETIKAKQLGEAALARVVEDIDADIGDDMVPNWNSGNWAGGAFESLGSGAKAGAASLLSGYATNYVPRFVWNGAEAAANNAEWINFSFVNNGQTITIGRYAYIALDCSGLFDVNFDYSPTNYWPLSRASGHSLYELQLTNAMLAEINESSLTNVFFLGSSPAWKQMIACRVYNSPIKIEKPWYRLETAAEINPFLARGYGAVGRAPFRTGATNINFVTYSRIPEGYLLGGSVGSPVALGTTLAELIAQQGAIVSEFTAMGVADPNALFNNLRDYVDPDNQPFNLNSFSTEAVPLINEVVVSNAVAEGGGIVTNSIQVFVEVWHPFTGTNNNSYVVTVEGVIQSPFPATLRPVLNQAVNLPPTPWTAGRLAFITTPVARATATGSFDLTSSYFDGRVRVREGSAGGTIVDESRIRIEIGELHGGVGVYQRGVAANDPRLNWNTTVAGQWTDRLAAQFTLGATNLNITHTNVNADGHALMYVANRPLQTVGELGLLMHDASRHWQTISLLDGPNFLPVLDRFVITNAATRAGLINPNSYNTGVVGVVFNEMPVERVPLDPAIYRLNSTNALALARRFSDKNIAFTNLSDMRWLGPQITAASMGVSNAFQESIVRNSAGLFAPRQQLFTVLLNAQVLQDNSTNVLAEQRGVGLVWRDPYPVNGRHEIRVRNFRWLTE